MCNIGIDIGGTTIKLGVLNAAGALAAKRSVDTPDTPDGVADAIREAVSEFSVESLGISTAGTVDRKTLSLTDLGGNVNAWGHYPLKDALAARGVRLDALENDMNCALIGEMHGADAVAHTLWIGIGTGIGGAYYGEDGLFRGDRGHALEIGHTIVVRGGRRCSCGQRGCAEAYFSAGALKAARDAAGFSDTQVFLASADPAARAYLEGLADFCIGLENTFDPARIVIGGGIAEYAPQIGRLLSELVRSRGNANCRGRIAVATKGNDAGMIGAALLGKAAREEAQ